MSGDDFADLAYFLILVLALVGWLWVEAKGRMGQAVRQALAWLLILVALAAGYGLWQDFSLGDHRQVVVAEGQKIVIARAKDDHFYVQLTVGEVPITFMVDSGASNVVLSDRDTDRLKIDRASLAFLGQANTANGMIRTAQVTLKEVKIEGQAFGDIRAFVGDGPLGVSLLGMDFLNRFQSVEFTKDRLTLTR